MFEQGGAGVVATLALAAQQLNVPLEVQGAIAMVGSFIGLGLGRSVYRAATRRYPVFARGYLKGFDPDPVKAAEKAKVAAEKLSESLDDIMMRSFRSMMDAVTDEVVPILGYMAGLYTFEQKRPDAFFRGLGRLLCELEPGEVDSLRAVVSHVSNKSNQNEAISVEIDGAGRVWAWQGNSQGSAADRAAPHAIRVLALLKREQLATSPQPAGARYGSVSDPRTDVADVTMRIRPDLAARILTILESNNSEPDP